MLFAFHLVDFIHDRQFGFSDLDVGRTGLVHWCSNPRVMASYDVKNGSMRDRHRKV